MTSHPFDRLADRGKSPTSKRALDAWVNQAVPKTGVAAGRLGWLVASSVVIGALQRAVAADAQPRLLLKGGSYLEVRLGLRARATKDVDLMFRGEFDDFLEVLDSCLTPWGPLELTRSEVEIIEGARRVVKPRRFRVQVRVGGAVWRSVDVEVAPDEAGLGDRVEFVAAPPLSHFGLPSPAEVAGIAIDVQVAQKLHACSDPHQPPISRNDRARDIVDLLLLRHAFYSDGEEVASLREACVAIFAARGQEATALGVPARTWPPDVHAHPHWAADYRRASDEADVALELEEAVTAINDWIAVIDSCSPPG